MTQDEQDAILAEAETLAPPGFTLDRCRHDSITDPTLWAFHAGAQVGSATLGPQGWTVSRIAHGSPYTRRTEPTLALALAHICQPKKG
jgi:hypothetical protein